MRVRHGFGGAEQYILSHANCMHSDAASQGGWCGLWRGKALLEADQMQPERQG